MWSIHNDILIEEEFKNFNTDVIFTLAAAGNMKIPKNRNRFDNLVVGEQIHSSNVRKVTSKDIGKTINNTDGLITDEDNLSLGIFTADCMAIYLCDIKNRKIAIVHAGWKGLQKNIIMQTLTNFSKDAVINAAISPNIKKCCYAVREDVGSNFPEHWKNGFLDITAVAIEQLNRHGVTKISVADFCTCCDERFFSYRRNNTEKRHLAVIKKLEGSE